MGKRSKNHPPRAYHDGLIPATHDTYQSYPEVVPDDYDQVKHEKSYPELAPPPDADSKQQQQQQQQLAPDDQHSTILPASSAHSAHHPHQEQQQQEQQQSQLSGSGAGALPLSITPVIPALHPLPRTSGVHSLRQAWSELDESDGDDDRRGSLRYQEDRPALWKRPILWVVVVMTAVIVALAGILGGVASGRIETALGSSGKTSGGSASSTPSVMDPTCPSANNLNYTSTAASMPKTFRIQCGSNYPDGDGDLGRLDDPVDNLAGCLDACAKDKRCVGAVFSPGSPASCWLKEFLGVVDKEGEATEMVSGVLWQ
ncbi:hypothetical protein MYCTH_2306125 [Thermothelomyces thermophilus ATCC 42464]|uniref:Apple domain-containing protein n=1 Tax=Thermothelomyces thermophilus (strain ATCC 42464 / BCRC 31852 / DSM 1799) TaxID=573729 RepID=G2QGY9_THET4|nr:uncharacterized protein MYCTH_2306125 [Thermothelomyces thermophilus ATCC 42464]AEO58649.1 hypothetical protein MYCTH_2306125 [Thermothelomyces thermophilus ATCC 42464]